MRLTGKVTLITGGSRGIGRGIAELFAREGATAIITAKDEIQLQKTAQGFGAIAIPADVRNEKQVQEVISKISKKFGRLDILVNNAGVFPKVKPLDEITEEEWNEVIDVNLNGPYRFTKAAIPLLKKNGGNVINIASTAGLKAYKDFSADAYSASKAALVLLTKCWALEYAKYKIRVNCICPGVVETDMAQEFLATPALRDMMNFEYPLGRIGTVNDVANAALYFATDDSSWATGAILPLDGGESSK